MSISIITASYNYENYIKETIESVLTQTYQDWEMIIVDDGSRDNSVDVIRTYCEKDNRIKLFTHENGQNKGLVETLKLAVSKASGEWIAFLESDDIWREDYLEKKVPLIEKYPDIDFFFNDVELFGDETRIKELTPDMEYIYAILNAKPFPRNLQKYFCKMNPVFTLSCVMVKKSTFLNCNFNSPVISHFDQWIYSQIAKKDFYYISQKLTKWRLHSNSYIDRDAVKEDKLKILRAEICQKCPLKLDNILFRLILALESNKKFEKALRGFIKILKNIESKFSGVNPDYVVFDKYKKEKLYE